MDNLYLNDHCSDVVCYVGENKTNAVRFPAHKCVLTLVSPVFVAMLGDNNFEESASGEILFSDISPNAFNGLLFFAYTGRLKDHAVSEMPDILYAAKKYLIDDLTSVSLLHLLEKHINLDNFWSFYNIVYNHYSELMPADIVLRTRNFLAQNTTKLLHQVDFENLSHVIVNTIVESDFINPSSEFELFNAVVNWARVECCRQKVDVTSRNKRHVLADIVYKFRFYLMTREELKNGPVKSRILTTEESELLLGDHQNESPNLPLPWNNKSLTATRSKLAKAIWDFPAMDTKSDDEDPLTQSFLLASPSNFVFKNVVVCIKPTSREVEITCEIKDLHGFVIKEWLFTTSTPNDKEIRIKITKPICLSAFKCYEFKMHCTKGSISSKRFKSNVCLDFNIGKVLCVREFPNEIPQEFKTVEYWQRTLGNMRNSSTTDMTEPTIVKKIRVEFF